MIDWQQISDMDYRSKLALANAPTDIFTKIAILLVKGITAIFIILLPLQIITTAVGGCLIALTFGILLLVLSLIWLPFAALLLGTSWLWLHAWYTCPILLIPGVLIAIVADLFIMLAPEPEREAKHAKLCIASDWPLSWYLIKPPA